MRNFDIATTARNMMMCMYTRGSSPDSMGA